MRLFVLVLIVAGCVYLYRSWGTPDIDLDGVASSNGFIAVQMPDGGPKMRCWS